MKNIYLRDFENGKVFATHLIDVGPMRDELGRF